MIGHPETGRHTAFAFHPALECDGLQVAAKVITPCMVNALKVFRAVARVVQADQGPAMRATVFECGDRSVIVAGDHDRHPPNNGCPPVSGIGYFVFKAEIIPDWAFKDPFLFDFRQ
jgi:hypothetical protein